MCLSPALAYVSGDGIKKDDFLTEAILVATYRGTCGKRGCHIRSRRKVEVTDRVCLKYFTGLYSVPRPSVFFFFFVT